MKLGLIGLGRMGYNLALNALDKGHVIAAFNRSRAKTNDLAQHGALSAYSINELVQLLSGRKVIWLMLPSGEIVDQMIQQLLPLLSANDIIIDGGNSFYKDSIRRAQQCRKKSVFFLDIGTSGGILGARHGACMMIGGEKEAFDFITPFIHDVCVKQGYGHMGKSGAGHYAKMVHNGIEYGMMQAIGEGYQLLAESPFSFNLKTVSNVYAHGSVIRSWLIDLIGEAIESDPGLSQFSGIIGQSGEGAWTAQTAHEMKISIPVIQASLEARATSQHTQTFSAKVVSALRFGFGQHTEKA